MFEFYVSFTDSLMSHQTTSIWAQLVENTSVFHASALSIQVIDGLILLVIFNAFKYSSAPLTLWIVTCNCRWLGHHQVVTQWSLRRDSLWYCICLFHFLICSFLLQFVEHFGGVVMFFDREIRVLFLTAHFLDNSTWLVAMEIHVLCLGLLASDFCSTGSFISNWSQHVKLINESLR